MKADEIKQPTVKPEGLQGLLDIARRNLPELRRDAQTLDPVRDRRPLALLRRARERVDWRRLPGLKPREPRPEENLLIRLGRHFAIFVLLPTAIVAFYLFVIASDQYVSEAKFAVRGNVEPMAEASLGEFGGLIQKHNNQDSFIVRDYIDSRAMAEAAEASLGVSKMFARDEADFWTRYDPDQPVEKLVRYWRQHVQASIDALSGVITVSVRTLKPEDSLAIAKEVVARSETLVNDISRRAQADMVSHAQKDAAVAEERLKKSRVALQTFRNQWGIVDPIKSAEATLTTIGMMRKDKIKAENDLRVLRGSNLDEKSRGIQVLVATIAAIDGQMKQLQDQLTADGLASGSKNNITQALLEFEGLKTEEAIATKLTESAHLLLDRARIAASKQQVYLAPFVLPALPTYSLYPQRGYDLFITFFCALAVWSSIALILGAVRDQRL